MAQEATRPPLIFQVTVAAPPDAAFRTFFTEAERWLCRQAAIEPRAGGDLRLCWPDGCVEGTFVQYVDGRTGRFSWHFEGDPLPETMVVVSTTPDPRGTRVEVEHYGFGGGPGWEALYLGAARAWAGYLKNLRSVVETGTDLRESDE